MTRLQITGYSICDYLNDIQAFRTPVDPEDVLSAPCPKCCALKYSSCIKFSNNGAVVRVKAHKERQANLERILRGESLELKPCERKWGGSNGYNSRTNTGERYISERKDHKLFVVNYKSVDKRKLCKGFPTLAEAIVFRDEIYGIREEE